MQTVYFMCFFLC